jgi:hypothetical protein
MELELERQVEGEMETETVRARKTLRGRVVEY